MNYNENLILYLLHAGLNPNSCPSFNFEGETDWDAVFDICSEQGVLGIVADGVDNLNERGLIPEGHQFNHNMKMQWGYNVMKIEKTFIKQFKVSNMLAEEYDRHGIRTVVLKGLSVARLYPNPLHRPCGDLDCFLMGDYEKGNVVAEQMGADVTRDYYKHSHIKIHGLMVENHQFCTGISGNRRNKDFEKEIQKILYNSELFPIKNTKLLSPSPLFNAVFLTIHAWNHFMTVGKSLRQICDWAVFLNRYNDKIDWNKFTEIISIRNSKLFNFARILSFIAHKYIGVELPEIFISDENAERISEKLLSSVFKEHGSLINNEYGIWKNRIFNILKNIFFNDWKYDEFSDESLFVYTAKKIQSFIFERNPHL